eukprot:Clim_evm11s203 gene=Clim_evmTU11s203
MTAMIERYAFYCDWFDQISQMKKQFILIFYPSDDAVEMVQIVRDHKRPFLKRTKVKGLQLDHFRIGNVVTILSRQLTITDYADGVTRQRLGASAESTFAMVKPDAVHNLGRILEVIDKNGLKVKRIRMTQMTRAHAEQFYAEHQGKPFFPMLVEFMSSGPCVGMELSAPDCIMRWRSLLGPTNSTVAKQEAPKSIRGQFGTDGTQNACHGSDAPQSAERELKLFFSWLYTPELPPEGLGTLCLIKPHAILEGHLGKIVADLQDHGFVITAARTAVVDSVNIEEFLEVYKGVVAEYSGMVKELSGRLTLALALTRRDVSSEANGHTKTVVEQLRELAGPADSDLAAHLRPTTLRAKYGKDKVANAVHVTDLVDDATLEIKYWFKILLE